MKRRTVIGFLICLGLLSGHGATAQLDGSKPLICSAFEVLECEQNLGCEQHPPGGTVIPYFFQIDFSQKTITASKESGIKNVSAIKIVESNRHSLILQGTENGHGWNLVISPDTANMVLTIAADHYSFTVFGACISS